MGILHLEANLCDDFIFHLLVRNCLDLASVVHVRAGYVENNIALPFLFLLDGGAVEYFRDPGFRLE